MGEHESHGAVLAFDPTRWLALPGKFPAQRVVRQLLRAEAEQKNRYRVCQDGMVLIAHGVAEPKPMMIILDKVRRENLPSVGDVAGARRAIDLTPDEGLLEPTYCRFAGRNIVAMLTSGNGPRPRRLVDYLRNKLDLDVSIEPVITQNLDEVLNDMRISAVDVAIPVSRISRGLVGGQWAAALEAGSVLAEDGVVRVGMSVGRTGSRTQKETLRARFRRRIDELRGSGAISEFNSARVEGSIRGFQRSVDLLEDQFVEKTDVDGDRLNDPQRSAQYAYEILRESVTRQRTYLESVVPAVADQVAPFPSWFIEIPDDERQ